MNEEGIKKLRLIIESIIDYANPIYIQGKIDKLLYLKNVTLLSAMTSKEDFVILNDNVPKWINNVFSRKNEEENYLIINKIDEISGSDQEKLYELLKYNSISGESMPDNLKIILNSENPCKLNEKISNVIETYYI